MCIYFFPHGNMLLVRTSGTNVSNLVYTEYFADGAVRRSNVSDRTPAGQLFWPFVTDEHLPQWQVIRKKYVTFHA